MRQVAKRDETAGKSVVEMLLQAKLLTEEQVQRARTLHQADPNRKLEDILVNQQFVTAEQVALLTSLKLGIPFVNLKKQSAEPTALELVPEGVCRKYTIVPIQLVDGTLVVAMDDPGNIQAIDFLVALTKKRIEPVLATKQEILETIDLSYRVSREIEQQLSQLPLRGSGTTEAQEARLDAEGIAQAPVVRIMDLIIRQAARDRASDIHIEPQEDGVRVRFRIDGILHEIMSLPSSVHAALLSRIKIMSSLNIAERRRPQDGQISFQLDNRELDIRVATSNTVHGEMAVLRLLDKSFAFLTLPELGFLPESLEKYRTMLKTPFGSILISGPTGSGKTTSLYASLNQLDSMGRNIITIEDPVEYRFGNINQMQVNPTAGMTFATGLRACMRLDPDVILVGEIRDQETARISIQAALTGHLVLSSVHANDTVGVIYRLIDLGIEPFLIASGVVGIVAQRMVRRICPNCSRVTTVSSEERLAYEREMHEERTQFLYGDGCGFCANTGYLGRTGIYEVLPMTEPLRRLMLGSVNPEDIRVQAMKDGLITLWHDGMMKVKSGITTPYEVIRNVFSI